jgi:hypothetical protein
MELKVFLPKPTLKSRFNLNFILTWMKVIILKREKKDKYQNHYIAHIFIFCIGVLWNTPIHHIHA